MDPLSATASAIGIATFAWQSCKAAYELIDGLAEAPKAIAHAKKLLSETQNTLVGLEETLTSDSVPAEPLDPILQKIKLDIALKSTQGVCDELGEAIKGFIRHSTDTRFSNRDRIAVSFHEPKIAKFCQQLGDCQSTISLAIVSSRTSEDILGLDERFTVQEAALASLKEQLCKRQIDLQAMSSDVLVDGQGDSWSVAERDSSVKQVANLREVCEEALSTTRAKHTGQSFGDMDVNDSMAYQGEVGNVSGRSEQSFGKLKATNGSTAAQGRMDGNSFAIMFKKR